MQTTTAAYTTAADRAEQTPVGTVTADWFRGATPAATVDVADFTVTREITSDLPADVTHISGVSAATANIGLVGNPTDNSQHAGVLYSPYQQTAALAAVQAEGTPVTVALGLQTAPAPAPPEMFTQLVGQIRDLQVDAAGNGTRASVQVVDNRERFRFVPELPQAVFDDPLVPVSGLPQKPGGDVQWVIDSIARQAGYYATPPARADCALSATLHGSAWPEQGTLWSSSYWDSSSTSTAYPIRFAQARFALGTEDQPLAAAGGFNNFASWKYYNSAQPLWQVNGQATLIEGWFYLSPTHNDEILAIRNSSFTSRRVIVRTDGAGHLGAQWKRDAGTGLTTSYPATARITTTGWHYVGLHFTWDATTILRIRVDQAEDTVTGLSTAFDADLMAGAELYNTGAEAIQITKEQYVAGMWNDAFVPNSVLELGLSELAVMPPLTADADAWALLQAIAQGVGGVVLLDEPGLFQSWNRRHFGTAPAAITVQRTLRATVPLKSVTVQQLSDRIRNVVQVPTNPYNITNLQVIWKLDEYVAVPGQGTFVQVVDLSPNQAFGVVTLTNIIPSGGSLTNGLSGYRVARNRDGTGALMQPLSMAVEPFAGKIRVSWTNPNSFPAWLVTPSSGYPAGSVGLPTAEVVGRFITQVGAAADTGAVVPASTTLVEFRDEQSITTHGERPLTLGSSVWMQNSGDAYDLAQAIGISCSQPEPQWSSVTIVADAALQLGDLVLVTDDSGATGIDDPAWVVGITTRKTGTESVQDLTLRPVAPPGAILPFELGLPDRATLDGRWALA